MSILDDHILKMRWPEENQEVFKDASDWWNNARLDFYSESVLLDLYAEGYKNSGDIIAAYVEENRTDQDILVFPIVFLYRHYLELSIKDIIHDGNRLLNINEDFPTYHDLKKLWDICKPILIKIFPGYPTADLVNVESIIYQFAEKDPISFAFRYPTDKIGQKSIADLDRINIRNLRVIVDGVYSFFTGIKATISEALSIKVEIHADNMEY